MVKHCKVQQDRLSPRQSYLRTKGRRLTNVPTSSRSSGQAEFPNPEPICCSNNPFLMTTQMMKLFCLPTSPTSICSITSSTTEAGTLQGLMMFTSNSPPVGLQGPQQLSRMPPTINQPKLTLLDRLSDNAPPYQNAEKMSTQKELASTLMPYHGTSPKTQAFTH